jgi:hypothetical protein
MCPLDIKIYADLKYQGKTPLDYQYTLNFKKEIFLGWYQWEGEGVRKGGMRVYMVDVFCIHMEK